VTAPTPTPLPGRGEALRVWLRVAALSFGGPAGQIAVMQRILVDEKRWISQQRFLHALNFCMFLPGPEAQQLATYIGWLMHRWRGALVAGGLFVLPGFIAILALSLLYALHGESMLVAGIFDGIKPAVLAIVVSALIRIGRRALLTRLLRAIAAAAFIAIFALGVPFPLIVIGAAATGLLVERRRPGSLRTAAHGQDALAGRYVLDDDALAPAAPDARRAVATAALWLALWAAPVALLFATLGAEHTLTQEAVFFSKVAVVTFGGAYAVLAYVAQQAVDVYAWLQPGEMLDGLGMAETTPGPLIQVVQFVGFMGAWRAPGSLSPLTAAIAGAVVTTWVTFVPCFLWILTGAPYMEALRGKHALNAALAAITAAVTGVILNLSLWFAFHALFRATTTYTRYGLDVELPVPATLDPGAAAIAVLAFVLVFVFRRGMLLTIGVCAACGVLLSSA
jgi:chromate transporter